MTTVRSRFAAAASCVALMAAFGLSACSKSSDTSTTTTVSETAGSVTSDAGNMMANAGSMMSDAVNPDTPQDFVTKATIANMFEIEEAKVAVKTAKNPDVKKFAQQMITDHTKAGTEMKAVVAKVQGVTAPTALDDAHQSKLDDLKKKTGDDFDQDYVSDQKGAHGDAVSLFKNYADNGTDPDLKAFAAKTLPTLQAHKDMIDKM